MSSRIFSMSGVVKYADFAGTEYVLSLIASKLIYVVLVCEYVINN
jgi:hypothetical protein